MSDMSFKQAKELVERMEFSEIALRKSTEKLSKATKNFDKTLEEQDRIIEKIPKADKKISYLYMALAINIGFILGLFVGKYIL